MVASTVSLWSTTSFSRPSSSFSRWSFRSNNNNSNNNSNNNNKNNTTTRRLFFFYFLVIVLAANIPNADANITTFTCDESKCRTINPESVPGYWWLPPPPEDFAGGYTCWIPAVDEESLEPSSSSSSYLPCAEGYVGRLVPNVTRTRLDEKKEDEDGTTTIIVSSTTTLLNWYTCCPEEQEQEEDGDSYILPQQTCSDAYYNPATFSGWAVPDGLAPRSCIGDGYPFPRNTGAIIPMDHGDVIYDVQQFLCCDKEEEEEETPLDDDEQQQQPELHPLDQDGDLLVDSCSTAACTSLDGVGGDGDCFADGVTEPFTCNTKDKNNPFIHPTLNGHDDLNNYNFHYVCCIQKEGGASHPYDEENEWDGLQIALLIQSILSMITFLVSSIFVLGILTNVKVRSQAWNMYLVMVSIPDIVYNAFRFIYGIIVITRSNTFIQTTWTIDWFYAVSNLLLNAVIVFKVHQFLRAFKRMVRIPPPSIKGVLIQSFVVYVIAAGCGLWMFHLHTVGNNIAGSHPRYLQLFKISLCCMVIPAILFVTLICIDVWYRKLLPAHVGRTRTLALYFLRVILVFMVTWVPYLILITIGLRSSRVLGYIGLCISSAQGTLSVAVAMSKTDVQWAVSSFLRGQFNEEPPKEGQQSGRSGAISLRSGRESTRDRNTTMGTVRISGIDMSAAVDIGSDHFNKSIGALDPLAEETLRRTSSRDADLDNKTNGIDEEGAVPESRQEEGGEAPLQFEDEEEAETISSNTNKHPTEAQETYRQQQDEEQAVTNCAVNNEMEASQRGRIDMTGAVVDSNSTGDDSTS